MTGRLALALIMLVIQHNLSRSGILCTPNHRRAVPAHIHGVNFAPTLGNLGRRDNHVLFGNRVNRARPETRFAFRPGGNLIRRGGRHQGAAFIDIQVRDIFPPGLNVGLKLRRQIRLGFQEPFDHRTHALERGKRDHDNALGRDGAIEHFGVAIGRGFFVAPDHMLAGAFKTRSALLVGLQAQQAVTARRMFDHRAF